MLYVFIQRGRGQILKPARRRARQVQDDKVFVSRLN